MVPEKKGLTRNRKNDGFRLFVFVGKLQAEGPRGNCWPRCRVLKPTLSVARAYDSSKWLKRVDGEKSCTSWYDKCLSIFEGFRDPKWCRILVNPQQHVGLRWGRMGEKRGCYQKRLTDGNCLFLVEGYVSLLQNTMSWYETCSTCPPHIVQGARPEGPGQVVSFRTFFSYFLGWMVWLFSPA